MRRWIVPAVFTAILFATMGADWRTQNFMVSAPTQQLARSICEQAEVYRHDLAIEWLGRELPPWQMPCPIEVQTGPRMPAGGATSFRFNERGPFDWTMSIQGTPERLLDSVLPHEVTHTIFATHFKRPLPRWADEGACTTVEDASERGKQERLLIEFLTTNRGIAFNKMFAMKEYPQDILPLYSQGYALARFLISQGGKQKFVQYVGEGMDRGQDRNAWTLATKKFYGYDSLGELQTTWLKWVQQGTPMPVTQEFARIQLTPPSDNGNETFVAANGQQVTTPQLAANNQPPVAPQAIPEWAQQGEAASAARPATEGWYQRVRDDVRAGKAPPSDLAAADGPNPFRAAAATQELMPAVPMPPATALAPTPGAAPNAVVDPANPFRSASGDRQVLLEWRRNDPQATPAAKDTREWARAESNEPNAVFRR